MYMYSTQITTGHGPSRISGKGIRDCFRAKGEHLEWSEGLIAESRGQNLALTVLHVPCSFPRPPIQNLLSTQIITGHIPPQIAGEGIRDRFRAKRKHLTWC